MNVHGHGRRGNLNAIHGHELPRSWPGANLNAIHGHERGRSWTGGNLNAIHVHEAMDADREATGCFRGMYCTATRSHMNICTATRSHYILR